MNYLNKCIKTIVQKNNTFSSIRQLKCQRNYCSNMQEQQITISNAKINYLKVGNGKNSILCFPGALGTIWSDFKPQINEINKDNFTIIAFDPPGYGLSRPPNRKFNLDFYKTDATVAYNLMSELGIKKFSLLGWSDGGISSIILAGQYPEAVEKLIIWGANSYVLPEDIEAFESIRDTKKWSAKAREPLIKLYGEDGLQEMWTDWCDTQVQMQKNGGNICMEYVSKVVCPTLIIHGAKDAVVQAEHPNYLNANIRNSSLHIFPQGKHNVHLRYAQEFNDIVTKFILDKTQAN